MRLMLFSAFCDTTEMHQLLKDLAQSFPSTVLSEWWERGANQKNKAKAFCSESVMSAIKDLSNRH